MTEKERDDLIRRAEAKRRAAIAQVETEHNNTMSAIAQVYALAQEKTTTLPTDKIWSLMIDTIRDSKGRRIAHADTAGPAAMVRTVIADMTEFATPDISARIRKDFPTQKVEKAAISSVLNKLQKSKEIEIVSKGTGRLPHVYRKAALVSSNGEKGQ